MKKIIFSWLLSAMFLSAATAQYGTTRTGYEGDYFSLEGAIELFKQSYSLRDFERKLNTEDTWVNNLDLDYDGRIDYIRVEHRRQGRYHAIVLQVPLGRYDVQDVAVIEIEKLGRRSAVLQIVGDEDLYGDQVIVEPYQNDNYYYDRGQYNGYVNVFYWDAVQSILGYNYQVYVSPYRYHYYPTWWSPWRQYAWNVYRPRIVVYHRHHHVVHVHRVVHVHNFYKPHRVYSNNVLTRTNEVRVKHGKKPVQRTAVRNKNNRGNDYERGDKRVAEQPRNATSNNREKSDRVNQRVPSTVERSTPKGNKERANTTTRPSTSRANKQPERSTTTTKRGTTSRDSKATRSTPSSSSSKARRSTSSSSSSKASRNTTTRRSPSKASSSSRSSSAKKSSSRSTPKASSSSRSSSSSKSQGASRSSKQSPRSSASSSRSSSSSKKATRSTSSRSSSSKNKRG